MKVIIPKYLMGTPIAGSLERALASSPQTPPTPPAPQAPIPPPANINKSEYIDFPEAGILIAKYQSLNGKDWENTHFELANNGLFMPSIPQFMSHFQNIQKASEGKRQLLDGNGNPIQINEAQELWNYLSSTARGAKENFYTWLDAKFSANRAKFDMQTHRVKKTGADYSLEQASNVTLADYVLEDCYASLDSLSTNFLPTRKSNQSYEQGKNIYFYYPRNGKVAGFYAGSDRAFLSCGGYPSSSGGDLGGVLACAQKNLQVS